MEGQSDWGCGCVSLREIRECGKHIRVNSKSQTNPKFKIQNSKLTIQERHRHRYEVNNRYKRSLEAKGLVISGTSPDGKLVEAIELPDHPFFVGTQFHPEYKSRPLNPHPLFVQFIKAVKQRIKKL